MAMIKLFGDRYYNTDRIDTISIEPEEDYNSDEVINVWNVYANSHESNERVRQWMGQFETKEDAVEAVEELMSKIGMQVVEFIPDLN